MFVCVRVCVCERERGACVHEGFAQPCDAWRRSDGGHLSEGRPAYSPVAAQGHMPCMGVGHCTRRLGSAVIAPLYKGKGPRDPVVSYRGISLLSCCW
eukprot:16610-Chlamydomonas_euryale.AAC.11